MGRSGLRSAARGDLVVPGHRTEWGSRSFAVAGPKCWNKLPVGLRDLLVGPETFAEHLKRCKVWKLKQAETRAIFSERVQVRAVLIREEPGDVEKVWKDLKDCFLEEAVDVCGETRDITRQNETWWWNEEVAALVKKKQRLFKIWKEPKKCKKGCRQVGENCVGVGERLEMRVAAWT